MATIAPIGKSYYYDSNGDPLSGGKVYTYEAGTTTPKVTYTTQDETTANANPVILAADGSANIWLGDGGYKFVVTDSADVEIFSTDNLGGNSSTAFGANVNTLTSNTPITDVYANSINVCTSAITLSLLSASAAAEGFYFSVDNNSGGNVVIDPDGAETINGASSFTFPDGTSGLVVCNGTTWFVMFYTGDLLSADNTFTGTNTFSNPVTIGAVEYTGTDGTAGQFLTTDGAGNTSFDDVFDPSTLSEVTPALDDFVFGTDTSDTGANVKFLSGELMGLTFQIQDQKANNTDGGTFTSGAWQTRTLNTSVINDITGASLSTNQVTLPAGTYEVDAFAAVFDVDMHRLRLQNVTDSTTVVSGVQINANSTANAATMAILNGKFTIASSKTFELQHRCSTTRATNGFGLPANFGDTEVYANIKFVKRG